MKIYLSAVALHESTQPPIVSLSGFTLTINGEEYDLSVIPEGGQAEADLPFIGIVTREEVTIQYPYSTDIYEPKQSTNPDDYIIELKDGETLACPLVKRPVQESQVEEVIEDGI